MTCMENGKIQGFGDGGGESYDPADSGGRASGQALKKTVAEKPGFFSIKEKSHSERNPAFY